jgi:hypothetical protein
MGDFAQTLPMHAASKQGFAQKHPENVTED